MPLEKPTKPDAITAVPTPVPLRTDRANFAARGDAMMGWFPTGIAGVNTTLTYFGNAVNFVEQEANEAEASATAAAASNVAAAVNAAAAAASAGATVWVTGTTYAAGVVKYSPTNFQTYRDTVGGVSNTDPASDTTGRWISAMLPSVEAIGLPAMPPTAVFNFASGVIDRRFVESRSTAGTRYNIFGNLETLSAGVAKPTYDPATNECKGYLAEPAATYLAMRSTEMDNGSYWGVSNVTVTPNAAIGIDGALSAYKVETTSTGVGTILYRTVTVTAAQEYYVIRAKKGSGANTVNGFRIYNGTTATNLINLSINYDTGVVTQSVGSGATAELVGHGFWEIRIPITVGLTPGDSLLVYAGAPNGVYTAGDYAYVCAPDIADKPNLTHIPTAGSNVTTVGGGLTLDLTAHDEIINPAGFTVVVAVDLGTPIALPRGILEIGDGSLNNRFTLAATVSAIRLTQDLGGVSVASLSLNYVEGRNVIAFSYAADGSLQFCASGQSVVSGAGDPGPVIPYLYVGQIFVPGFEIGNPVEHITTFPRACTANELIALTRNL